MKKNIFVIFLTLPLVLLAQSSITIGTGATLTVGAGADVCAGSKTVLGTITGDGTWCTTLPLPVELISFSAECRTQSATSDKSVELKWTTATEVNNYGFAVERLAVSNKLLANSQQLNANGWIQIAFVQGHGNSNSPKSYSFTVNLDLALNHNLNPATAGKLLQYRLKQIDFDGKYEYSNVVEVKIDTPAQFALEQNYPNPFNPETTISYTIPANLPDGKAGVKGETINVTLKVYDVLGREVAILVDELKPAGTYNSKLSTQNFQLVSGVYFYTLHAGDFRATKKFLLMK